MKLASTRIYQRTRGLRFESLEPRLALTGLPLQPFTASLADYLAHPNSPGPVFQDAANVAVQQTFAPNPAVHDAVCETFANQATPPAPGPLQGEGEDPLPPLFPPPPPPLPLPLPPLIVLTSFEAEHAEEGWVRLAGTVSAPNPLGTQILFVGLVSGQTTANADGTFSLLVLDPAMPGLVFAYAIGSTTVLSDYLD